MNQPSPLDEPLLEAFRTTWKNIRHRHGLALRPPGFALHEGRTRLGLWRAGERTISLSRPHALDDPWLDVVETLLHELAHQVVDELLGGDERPHGPLFQQVLHDLGALPSAASEPPPVVRRVRKLLALAASPNQHEAELAMAKAQQLMLRHRMEIATLDSRGGFVRRQLGTPKVRQPRWRSILAAVVAAHFFTEVVRTQAYLPQQQRWGAVWEIVGRPEDVDMTAYAFEFVERTAERLWAAHKLQNPRAGRAHARFLMGVVVGFDSHLEANVEAARETGLVLVGDPALQAAWHRRHPVLRRRSANYQIDDHFHAGRDAGERLVLHRPVGSRGSGGGLLEGS
jgi:hypothetical protein